VARFYSNENIALDLVTELRHLGHDVLASFEAGRANAAVSDEEVLTFATTESRIVLTHNRRDFLRLHRRRKGRHAGLVVCSVEPDSSALAKRIHHAVSLAASVDDQVIRVNRSA
jgi:uncharacterized protein with PIN domain